MDREPIILVSGPMDGLETFIDGSEFPSVLAFEDKVCVYVWAGRKNRDGRYIYLYDVNKTERIRRRWVQQQGQIAL